MLYSTGEEDGWVNEKKKGKTAKTFAVMTMHYDNAWGWSQTSDYSQSIQPGTVLATATEAKAKEGQADHPADHAAHGSSKPSSERPEDVIGWWEMEADSKAEDARLEKWTKEEKAQEAEDIMQRVAEFEAGTDAWQKQRVDIRMRVAAGQAWHAKQSTQTWQADRKTTSQTVKKFWKKVTEFWKLEVERLGRRRDMLKQLEVDAQAAGSSWEFEKKQKELQEMVVQEADLE